MSSVESEVAERLKSVRQRVRAACERVDRDPEEVTLLGIGKRQPIERVRAAIAAGLGVLGENQVQEAVAKSAQLPVDLEWHFVGHLQSNKVKPAVRLFRAIHAVDRLKIARRIDLEAGRQGRRIEGLIQVNLGAEPTKHGYPADDLAAAMSPKKLLAQVDSGADGVEPLPGFDTFWYTWVAVNENTHLIP